MSVVRLNERFERIEHAYTAALAGRDPESVNIIDLLPAEKTLRFPPSFSPRRESKAKVDATLDKHAAAIRALGKRTIKNIIEIGRRLTAAKRLAGHGNWLPSLDREFGWTEKTAERFMSVHALAGKSDNLSNLEIPVSANRNEVFRLRNQAEDALRQRRGRTAAFADIKSRLHNLNYAMVEDIQAAEREIAAKEAKP